MATISHTSANTPICPGQVWKRIRGRNPGTLIKIESMRLAVANTINLPVGYTHETDDWHWVGVTNPKRRGMSYGSYIRRDYVLVSEPTSNTNP